MKARKTQSISSLPESGRLVTPPGTGRESGHAQVEFVFACENVTTCFCYFFVDRCMVSVCT